MTVCEKLTAGVVGLKVAGGAYVVHSGGPESAPESEDCGAEGDDDELQAEKAVPARNTPATPKGARQERVNMCLFLAWESGQKPEHSVFLPGPEDYQPAAQSVFFVVLFRCSRVGTAPWR
jgi:hypothetical protein